jgi:hypothetical protein
VAEDDLLDGAVGGHADDAQDFGEVVRDEAVGWISVLTLEGRMDVPVPGNLAEYAG